MTYSKTTMENSRGSSPTTDQLRLMASFLKDVANGESDICLKNKKKEKKYKKSYDNHGLRETMVNWCLAKNGESMRLFCKNNPHGVPRPTLVHLYEEIWFG